jgi:hypothetical protein
MKGAPRRPTGTGITTVKEYNYVASQKLPPVKGISSYKPMAGSHGTLRDQRLGRLGADHLRQ